MSSIEQLSNVSSTSAEGFRALRASADDHGPLTPKEREFCLLAGFAVTSNEAAFRAHCRRAAAAGADRTEVEQLILLLLGTSLVLVPVIEALRWTREEFEPAGT